MLKGPWELNKVSKMEEGQKHQKDTERRYQQHLLRRQKVFLEEWAAIFENNLLVKEEEFFLKGVKNTAKESEREWEGLILLSKENSIFLWTEGQTDYYIYQTSWDMYDTLPYQFSLSHCSCYYLSLSSFMKFWHWVNIIWKLLLLLNFI